MPHVIRQNGVFLATFAFKFNKMVVYEDCPICKSTSIKSHLPIKDYFLTQEDFEIFQCESCSFIFTRALESEENIGRYYKSEEYISHSDKKKGFFAVLYQYGRKYMLRKKYKSISRHQKLDKGKLLDIGSGTGHFIHFMQKKGWDVEGIEMDKSAREYSIREFSLKVQDNKALFSQEFEKKDVISLWHVLEHLYEPEKYMQRILELLKEDGLLLIALPNANSWDAKHYGKYWAAYDVPRHQWHFTPKSFQHFIQKFDLELVKIRKMPLDAMYVSILSEKYKQNSLQSIRGIINGIRSNIHCLNNAGKSSSVIYFLQKKKHTAS